MRKNRALGEKKADLLRELGKQLHTKGFPARPTGYGFRKMTDFGRVMIGLNIAEHETEFSAAIHVGVRFDEVEDLVNACNELLSNVEKKKTTTLGCELGNLRDGRRREWQGINVKSDTREIANEMAQFFFEMGLPYFERFASNDAAYAVLSREDRESRMNAPIPLGRAERAIALGLLIGGGSEARKMIEAKRRYLSEVNALYLPMFEEFVACFEKHMGASGNRVG